jgi:hypothetical protein
VLKIMTLLMGSYLILHFLVFPLWFSLIKPMMVASHKDQSKDLSDNDFLEFSGLATITHTVAIVLGLAFSRGAPSLASVQAWSDSVMAKFEGLSVSRFAKGTVTHPLFVTLAVLGFVICNFVPSGAKIVCWMAYVTFDWLLMKFVTFAGALEMLVSGGNLFSATIMVVFYVGLVSMGIFVHQFCQSISVSFTRLCA